VTRSVSRTDYNNNPPVAVAFIPPIGSASVRLHSQFVRLLFLQGHRETDLFFTSVGVQFPETNCDQFHFHRSVFSSDSLHLKTRVGLTLDKSVVLRNSINLDGAPITSKSHSPITLTNFSSINLVFIFRCSSSTINPVYTSRVDS
jgi:hypothetical protein